MRAGGTCHRIAAVFAGCSALSGCGGPNGGLPTPKLIDKAQQICLHAQARTGKIIPPAPGAGLDATAAYFDRSARIAEQKTAQLEQLKPNGDIAGAWNAVITAQEAVNDRMRSLERAAGQHDLARLRAIEADTAARQELIATTAKLGTPLCG